jgi:hypothetical protein
MDANAGAQLFIPLEKVERLRIPALSITDGTIDPEWVSLHCVGRHPYTRTVALRLPLDAASASIACRWTRFRRLERVVLLPLVGLLLAAGIAARYTGIFGSAPSLNLEIGLWTIGLALLWCSRLRYRRLTIPQHPTLVARRGVLLKHLPVEVAHEWTNGNADVRILGY